MNFQMSDLQYFNPEEWFEYGNHVNSYTDLGLVVGKVSKPIMPQVQENVQDVPGMYGSIFTGNDYDELTFTIPVTLMAFDHTSYNIIVENLRAMFTADSRDPGIEYPLQFGDRPEVKYYGHWGQMSDPVFLTPNDWQASAQLTFICSQPYGYLDQQTKELTYPDQPIKPKGNATTYPIYDIHLKQDIYGIGFTTDNNNGYVAVGYQEENGNKVSVDNDDTDDNDNRIVDNMPLDTDEEPTVLSDWIKGNADNKGLVTFTVDGDQAGQMSEREGGGITPGMTTRKDMNLQGNQNVQARNYGNPSSHGNNWYGPLAIHPQFNNPTDDWQLMVNLWNQKFSTDHSSDRAMGHCEIYLLDDNGHRRGKIWIHDWQKGEMPRVGFSLGKNLNDEVQLLNYNDDSSASNDARGPQRIGNYNVQRDRPTPSRGFPITSLTWYKELVVNKKKNKKSRVKTKLRSNRKRYYKRKYRRKTRSDKGKKRGHYRKRR